MQPLLKTIVEARWFEYFIVALIILNGVVLGLETSASVVAHYGRWLEWANGAILAVFVIEAILKISAVAPRLRLYFGSGWNLFDFSVVVVSLIPATGEFAMIARLARLLRVARLISTIPELRLIVSTLVRSIPSMGHVLLLMSIIFYIYAVAGYHLFHEHDPTHWSTLGLSLLTLFRVVTLEDWTDVMYKAMEMHPWMWMYFVSFVIIGTFVVINLFIAVVLNNLEEAKQERLESLRQPPSKNEILKELRDTQQALSRLQSTLESSDLKH
ncbi:MAG: ion transporter [Gammaproteobacteria bacterium]|jgi:voltage-gated sodium channel|nr:ion transporter [Gammaproteobacteria bacterium]